MKTKAAEGIFVPMRLTPPPSETDPGPTSKLSISATLKGPVADEFEKLKNDFGLSRSQLMVQMVYHCMGRSAELKDFYRRLMILGE